MKELHKKAAIIVYKMQFSARKNLHHVWMAKALEAAWLRTAQWGQTNYKIGIQSLHCILMKSLSNNQKFAHQPLAHYMLYHGP